jgi:predicted enzyme related to lactoylglutathione lyase
MQFGGTVLYVDDVPRVKEFYHRAFGLPMRFYDEVLQFAELETGSAPLAIASHQLGEMLMPGQYRRPDGGQPSGVEVAFITSDVPAAFTKAVGAGATAVAEPKAMPWGATVAYVRSIEGTLIGFSTPVGGGQP